jgi:hypothetical protein
MEQPVFEFTRKNEDTPVESNYVEMDTDDSTYDSAADFRSFERTETKSFRHFVSNYPSIVDERYLFMTTNRRRKLISRNNSVVNDAIRDMIPEVVENTEVTPDQVPCSRRTWSVVKEVQPPPTVPEVTPSESTATATPASYSRDTVHTKRKSLLRQHLGTPAHDTNASRPQDVSDVTDEEMVKAMTKRTSPSKNSHMTPSKTRTPPNKTRNEAAPSVGTPPQRQSNVRSRMCFRGETCNRKATCTFAHTLEEFAPVECRFAKCRRFTESNTCSFFHKNAETKLQFLERTENARTN